MGGLMKGVVVVFAVTGFVGSLIIVLIFLPLCFLWAFALVDIFQRDMEGWEKALWVIFVVLIPIFGMLIYFIARPVTKQDVEMQKTYEQEREFSKASAAADKLHKLAELRDKGDLTPEQFEKQKAKLLKE
jgi:hypothetical protein